VATGEELTAARTRKLLARVPDLEAEAGDRQAFALSLDPSIEFARNNLAQLTDMVA